MDRLFPDCMLLAVLLRLDYKPASRWAPEVSMPCLTEEIRMVDEVRLISKEAQFVVDQSLEFQCLRLAHEDVRSIVGVN